MDPHPESDAALDTDGAGDRDGAVDTDVTVDTERERRDLRRFTAYIRWSFYVLVPAAALGAALSLAETRGWAEKISDGQFVAIFGALCCHAAASLALAHRWLHSGRSTRREVIGYGVLSAAVILLATHLTPLGEVYRSGAIAAWSPFVVAGISLAVVGLHLPTRRLATWTVVVAAAIGALFLAGGGAPVVIVTVTVTGGCMAAVIASMGPLTRWMLDIVQTLAASRITHARLAVAEERLRFSRDLHDVYGRTLSAIALKSEVAAELARRSDERAVAEMQSVRDLAQASLTEVRTIVSGYRRIDPLNELAGARSVLRSAGTRLEVDGVDVALRALDDDGRTAAAWVLREGTTNVLRHSTATVLRIRAVVRDGYVDLQLANDKPTSAAPTREGTGLLGLRERVQAIGGTVRTGTENGHFVLEATLPTTPTPER